MNAAKPALPRQPPRRRRGRAAGGAIAAATLLCLAAGAGASDRTRCAQLGGVRDGITFRSSLVPPGFALPDSIYGPQFPAMMHIGVEPESLAGRAGTHVRPAFCRVEAVAPPSIRFEVWLPARGWNRRLLGVGNGGTSGAVPYANLKAGIELGYAAVGSDLGHQGGFTDAAFAIGQPQLVVDWGHRATHVMTAAAKNLIHRFYAQKPRYAYFAGCSGGGRQGLMEAQRYPGDYDGILAGNPTINFARLTIAGRLWSQMAMFRAPGGYIPAAKIPVIAAAVNAACDRLDGVADGILADPRQCRFDPATIACQGADRPDCLTVPQTEALRAIHAGARDSHGRQLFGGILPGGELGPGGWQSFISGAAPYRSGQWAYAAGVLPPLLAGSQGWDMASVDFDADVERLLARPVLGATLSSVIDAYDPDLSAFAARGGKLIHYHGWNDAGVSALNSTAYYEAVVSRERALGRVQSFYRMFMVPGMQHCSGGPGTDRFDGLAPLRTWVEHRQPPERITARRVEDGRVALTRPLCPYPAVARWSGQGDSRDAANFACVAPRPD